MRNEETGVDRIESVFPGYKYYLVAVALVGFFSGAVLGEWYDWTQIEFWLASSPIILTLTAGLVWAYRDTVREAIRNV